MFKIKVIFLSLALIMPNLAWPHSGGLNANGCHRQNSNNSYHCHESQDSSSSNSKGVLIAGLLAGTLIFWYYIVTCQKDELLHIVETKNEKSSKLTISFPSSANNEDFDTAIKIEYSILNA